MTDHAPEMPAATVTADRYCPRCGETLSSDSDAHPACRSALALEPPRYCPQCRRRMVVQVLPQGWRARCSVHGEITR